MGIRGMKAPVALFRNGPREINWWGWGGNVPNPMKVERSRFAVGHILHLNDAAAHHKWNFHLAKSNARGITNERGITLAQLSYKLSKDVCAYPQTTAYDVFN